MAKRYSNSDQQKMLRDTLGELTAKGADAQLGKIVHPGGITEGCKQLRQNERAVIDQSQEQTEKNREHMRRTQRGLEGR